LDRRTDPFYEYDHIVVCVALNVRANALRPQGGLRNARFVEKPTDFR
jgi:hypothetical protein